MKSKSPINQSHPTDLAATGWVSERPPAGLCLGHNGHLLKHAYDGSSRTYRTQITDGGFISAALQARAFHRARGSSVGSFL